MTVCYVMNSMFCIRCYLNVSALYTALELFVMIEHFLLTQTEGILSTDFFLKISFNLIFKSSLLVLCIFVFFISHFELYLLRFVSGKN